MKLLKIALAGVFAFSLVSCDKKDINVFYNGTVLTMEDDMPQAEAVLVKNGIIEYVGTTENAFKKTGRNAKKTDLNGAILVPGFIDGHSHISQYTQILTIAQLAQAETFDDIVRILSEYATDNPDTNGGWIIGFGYDNNSLAERRHPTRELLDKVSTERPIIITHASGHMGVYNSKALELFNVTAQTPTPPGGFIAHDKNGNPTGYMEETAFLGYAANVPPSDSDPVQLIKKAQQLYLSKGITTAQDSLIKESEYNLLASLADKNAIDMDIIGYVDLKNCPDLAQAHPERLGKYLGNFKVGGYKIFLDGSPQGRTAWLTEPYLPIPGAVSGTDADPQYKGYPTEDDDAIENFVRTAAAQGLPLQAHCNGDAAADQFIRVHKKLAAEGLNDFHRSVMIHCQITHDGQFDALKELGIVASMFPAHIYHWGDVHLQNLGDERGSRVSAMKSALDSGVTFTVHQDSPVVLPDMIESLWCMTCRRTKSGKIIAPQERISALDGLKAMTVSAAWQIGEEDSKGSIKCGKRADFAILDMNPLEIPPEEIRNIKVLGTIKDGKTLYSRSK